MSCVNYGEFEGYNGSGGDNENEDDDGGSVMFSFSQCDTPRTACLCTQTKDDILLLKLRQRPVIEPPGKHQLNLHHLMRNQPQNLHL
jgi:hypothetical protein